METRRFLRTVAVVLLAAGCFMVWAQPETFRKPPPEPMVLVVYISQGGVTESARVCQGRSSHHSILVPLDDVHTALAQVDNACGLVLAVEIQ